MPPPLRPIDFYTELLAGKGREKHGFFLVEGARAVMQVASVSPGSIDEVLATGLTDAPFMRNTAIRMITDKQLRLITASQNPTGPVAVVRIPPDSASAAPPAGIAGNILLCEHIQDPGNVGTLIRTAAAFGFAGVIMSDKCADPFAPKAVQASAGSILSLWIRRTPDYLKAVTLMRNQKFVLAAADVRGTSQLDAVTGTNRILALGNEGSGLTPALLDQADVRFTIPIKSSSVESLNVASCGAICMYALSR